MDFLNSMENTPKVPVSAAATPSLNKTINGKVNGRTKSNTIPVTSIPSTNKKLSISNAASQQPTPRSASNTAKSTPNTNPSPLKTQTKNGTPNPNNMKTVQSPMGAQPSYNSAIIENAFRKEELLLKDLEIRKLEISSRFKHRQEIFKDSPMDLFMSTLGDCLGIKDEEMLTSCTIPKAVVDHINGSGKRKPTKAAQRARDQDSIDISIKDNKLLMKSKFNKSNRSYSIALSNVAAIFKGIGGNFKDLSTLVHSSSPSTSSNMDVGNPRKRKASVLEISPQDSIASVLSPDSNIMSDSKKIKVDSPDDPFMTKSGATTSEKQEVTNEAPFLTSGTSSEQFNVWDWNNWTSAT